MKAIDEHRSNNSYNQQKKQLINLVKLEMPYWLGRQQCSMPSLSRCEIQSFSFDMCIYIGYVSFSFHVCMYIGYVQVLDILQSNIFDVFKTKFCYSILYSPSPFGLAPRVDDFNCSLIFGFFSSNVGNFFLGKMFTINSFTNCFFFGWKKGWYGAAAFNS